MKITEEIYQKIELDKIDIKCASKCTQNWQMSTISMFDIFVLFLFYFVFFIKSPGIIMMYKQDIEHSLLTRKWFMM